MGFSHSSTRKSIRSFFVSLVISSFFSALSAHAATVTLNNGDRLTGELLELSGNTLSFQSSVFGKVEIPWKEVSKLISDEGVRVQLTDGTTLEGKIVLDEDGVMAIDRGNSGQAGVLTRQDLVALNPPIVDTAMKYTGRLDLGGSFARGNSTDEQLNVNGEFIARRPEDRYTLAFDINESRSAGVKTASTRRLRGQYDAFITDKDFLFASALAESDELADLDLRTALGAGYGHQFIESDVSNLSAQAGVNYVNEDYGIAPDESFPSLSLGLKYDRSFFNNKLVYFQNVNIDTSLKDADDTLIRTRLGLRMPIAKGVNVSTQLNIDYDNQPVLDKKNTDTTLIFSVGYGF